jgi:pimeloyl-ACP methyl ester carboxylesterase
MVGIPAPVVWIMRLMPGLWRKLAAVGHTLPYDAAVMGDFTVPVERLGTVAVPTLVMHGAKTDARLKRAAGEVAGAVPQARSRTLPGQNHNVSPAVLGPAVLEFLRAAQAR